MALQTQRTIPEEITIVNGLPRVVWGAIVAGALMVVMAIELGLGLLGAGIGFKSDKSGQACSSCACIGCQ